MIKKKSEKYKISGLNFMPIGGCSEIGMNLYAYIFNDQWILIDMGIGFDNSFGREVLVPSPEILIKNKSKIKALLITHSHEDHIGAIPYIWPMIECPVYGRPFAIEMIRDKLFQYGLEKDVPLIKASTGTKISIGDFEIEFISVAHSTPESSALAITTPEGVILHTGDWRLDDDPVLGAKTDEDTIKRYGESGISTLVCDSTNVFRDLKYGSEKEVRKNLIDIVKKFKKNRILITCFASNLARLETCYLAAKESGRQLVVAGRSIKKIERIAKTSGYFSKLSAFLDEKKANSLDPSKILIVCTGSQGEQNSALSKIASDIHKNVKLQKDDVIIFSSRVIPGNEKAVMDIQNILIGKGIKIVTDIDHEIHASGHPSKEELEYLYKLAKPHSLIPVHGETVQLYRHAEIAKEYGIKNIVIPQDGSLIKLSDGNPKIIDKLETSILAVDGNKLIPLDGVVYKQRKLLASNGIVSALVKVNRGSIKLVDMMCFGIFEESEKTEISDIRDDIASEIKVSLEGLYKRNMHSTEIRLAVEKIIKTIFVDTRSKKPIVFVHVMID